MRKWLNLLLGECDFYKEDRVKLRKELSVVIRRLLKGCGQKGWLSGWQGVE